MGQPGFQYSGYTNVSTSDGIVHGQVKQSGAFSFVRIYESGHVSTMNVQAYVLRISSANTKIGFKEVPFYQPALSLAIFERAIAGLDIATGLVNVTSSYRTVGLPTSTYREGNSTIQFEVLSNNSTYNTTINKPDPPSRLSRFTDMQGEQFHYGKVFKPVKP